MKQAIQYSEAFKMEVVRRIEREGLNCNQIREKYGIRGGGTVEQWVRKYGNGTLGKVIRVETPDEINQLKRLKERVRRLEAALADANLDLALEKAYTRLACERAGIKDMDEFKKKVAGTQGTSP